MLISLFMTLVTLAHAENGGWSGNGGEFHKDQDNAWFLKEAGAAGVVEYCVRVDPSFPYEKPEVSGMVRAAFDQWVRFFQRYGMDQFKLGTGFTMTGIFPDRKLRQLDLNLVEVADCQASRQQVEFLFGVSNAVIDAYRKSHPHDLGTAVRGAYDQSSFRSGGYVWIGNPSAESPIRWTNQPRMLKHLLLHEIGHVFGMPHDSTWVMLSDVADQLHHLAAHPQSAKYAREYQLLGAIEAPHWPYRLDERNEIELTYPEGGGFGVPDGWLGGSIIPAEIRELLGLSAEQHYQFRVKTPHIYYGANLRLEITDPLGRKVELTGELPIYSRWMIGPGIYTEWLSEGSTYSARLVFAGGALANSEGSFLVGETRLPVLFVAGPMPAVKIFLPEAGKWWQVGGN